MSSRSISRRVSFLLDSGNSSAYFHTIDASMQSMGLTLVEIRDVETDKEGRIQSAHLTWDVADKPAVAYARGGRLGVVIPTLNCRDYLVKQVAAIRAWLDIADEIIVIDGHSTDGSPEYLAEELHHPRLRVVKHPKGLWESWNAGIALLSTDYVLISTAGDAMSRHGIETLLDAAKTTGADVVMSPPKFESDSGDPPSEDWPVHELIRKYKPVGIFIPPHEDLMHLTYWYGGWGWGILSSSASNLYRTRLMQQNPWPTDVGYRGDVAWGLRHMRKIKLAVTPEYCSTFNCHNTGEPRPMGNINLALFYHAAAGLGLDRAQIQTILASLRKVDTAEPVQAKTKADSAWLLAIKSWFIQLRLSLPSSVDVRQVRPVLPSLLRIYLERNGHDFSKPLQF